MDQREFSIYTLQEMGEHKYEWSGSILDDDFSEEDLHLLPQMPEMVNSTVPGSGFDYYQEYSSNYSPNRSSIVQKCRQFQEPDGNNDLLTQNHHKRAQEQSYDTSYTLHQQIPQPQLPQALIPQRQIPARKLPNIQRIPITALENSRFQLLYMGFASHFNAIQSECFPMAYNSDSNLILSAPTGAGKTVVMELAILRLYSKGDFNSKAVYIAPTKALCNERGKDWGARFSKLSVICKSLTGDTPFNEIALAQQSQIIITTPEKWDSITRQWKDSLNLIKTVKLILVDEPTSGATLEAVITRMQCLTASYGIPSIRIVAVSATIPNLNDFGQWLRGETMSFGEEFRPIKLHKVVIGCSSNSPNAFVFEDSLKYRLVDLLRLYSKGKPTLIFCSTRKSTMQSAEFLASEIGGSEPLVKNGSRKILLDASYRITDRKLAGLVEKGVAFHNASLSLDDRSLVESLFLSSNLLVICATSTLAVGVNLPAHLVIIKGTSHYNFASQTTIEYSDLDILQMMGRAGRPQFDQEGTAIIMTSKNMEAHYQNMGKETCESNLHICLMEHLNAEVSLGQIKNEADALLWLHSTFLYVRIKKNPGFYRLKNCSASEALLTSEKRLEAIFRKDLAVLEEAQLVERTSNGSLVSTRYGVITCKYFMKFKTVETLISVPPHASIQILLEYFSKSEEFSEIRFHQDKGRLNSLNKNPDIRYPIQGKISEVWQKVSLLIQASIGTACMEPQEGGKSYSLQGDSLNIMKIAQRSATGMVQLMIAKSDYRVILSALRLQQAVSSGMWSNSLLVCKQIDGLGIKFARTLSLSGINSFSKLLVTEPSRIEMLLNRNPPFGSKILQNATLIPEISMITRLEQKPGSGIRRAEVFISLHLNNPQSCSNRTHSQFTFVCGTSLGNFIDTRTFSLSSLVKKQVFTLKTSLRSASEKIVCSLICNDIAGIDKTATIFPNSLDEFEEFDKDESGFWKNLDHHCLDATVESIDNIMPPKEIVFCRHTCLDKEKCKHVCCKSGLVRKPGKDVAQKGLKSPELPSRNKKRIREKFSFDVQENFRKKRANQATDSDLISLDDFVDFLPITPPSRRVAPEELSSILKIQKPLAELAKRKVARMNSETFLDSNSIEPITSVKTCSALPSNVLNSAKAENGVEDDWDISESDEDVSGKHLLFSSDPLSPAENPRDCGKMLSSTFIESPKANISFSNCSERGLVSAPEPLSFANESSDLNELNEILHPPSPDISIMPEQVKQNSIEESGERAFEMFADMFGN